MNEAKNGRLKSVQLHFIHRVAQYVRRGWKAKRNNFGRPNETISNEIDLFFKLKNYENVPWRTTMKLFPVKLNVLINLSFWNYFDFFFLNYANNDETTEMKFSNNSDIF